MAETNLQVKMRLSSNVLCNTENINVRISHQEFCILSHGVVKHRVSLQRKTVILFPYNTNWFVFLIEVQGVFCEAGSETLCKKKTYI